MADPISISGIILASISTLALGIAAFLKGIKKCNISKSGISIERTMENNELIKQQEYTIKLIELMKELDSKDNKNNKEKEISTNDDISVKSSDKINERLQDILNILDNDIDNKVKNDNITNFIIKKNNKKYKSDKA